MKTLTKTVTIITLTLAITACQSGTLGGDSWHDPEYQKLRQETKQNMLYKMQDDAIKHNSGV